jgi:predicted transcriptional regulator
LATGKRETIKRHLETLQSVNSLSNQCKYLVKVQKIASKTNMDEIANWNDNIESKFEEADFQIARFSDWLAENERQTKAVAQEELFIKNELKLHEEKLRMQSELVNSAKIKTGKIGIL